MNKVEKDILEIENMIYVIRGHRVMFDSDLAKLYGVETKALNQSVKRNIERFPEDFMFSISEEEMEYLRNSGNKIGSAKYLPNVFTENGVAMLSSILKSANAIHINILIIRTFTKLRSFLSMEASMHERMGKLEQNSTKLFKIIFERLDSIDDDLTLTPSHLPSRIRIGLKNE